MPLATVAEEQLLWRVRKVAEHTAQEITGLHIKREERSGLLLEHIQHLRMVCSAEMQRRGGAMRRGTEAGHKGRTHKCIHAQSIRKKEWPPRHHPGMEQLALGWSSWRWDAAHGAGMEHMALG